MNFLLFIFINPLCAAAMQWMAIKLFRRFDHR